MTLLALVVLLGAFGAMIRALLADRLPALAGTLAVNLSAAFLLGLCASWEGVLADGVRIGLLGAASTWSTLAHELAGLLRDRRAARAASYLTASLVLGVAAAWLGLELSGA